ncbi:MAG TPA: hypothetical protein VGE59_01885 [Patescibacteria group bacterium]
MTLFAFFVALIDISIGANFVLWGGGGYIFPAFIILLAASHNWSQLIIWISIYLLTGIFIPLSPLPFFILLLLCLVAVFLFRRVVAPDSLLVQACFALVLLAVYIAASYYSQGVRLSLNYIGSLMLTLPLIVIWFLVRNQRRRRLS